KDASGAVVSTLDDERAHQLIAEGTIGEGMIPKVECCLEALKNGVKKTHIVDGRMRHAVLLEMFTREGVGTEVVRSLRQSPRARAEIAPPARLGQRRR
ncbi:MAG: hypothetical protein ABI629_19110, partial [bacterium]